MKKTILNFIKFASYFLVLFISLNANALDGYERGGPFQSYLSESDIYSQKIQPILDRRCVVCHSCFEAPCQLKLTSPEMLIRGATKHQVNGGTMSATIRPDMMTTLQKQRAGGFFPVVGGNGDSILLNAVMEGHDKTDLPAEKYIPQENRMCVASAKEFRALPQAVKKALGMPYYMAPMNQDEYEMIASWAANGSPMPSQSVMKAKATPRSPRIIQYWEDFFNTNTWKAKWTSRYLYEHLFTAHLYFDDSPGEFYELVRSSTAAPDEIVEIATQRPFEMDDKYLNKFYYRLRKVQQTIVHKQHFVYRLNIQVENELKFLFWDSEWNRTEQQKPFNFVDKNPFISFEHIPANARYRWMLKNSKMLLDMDMRSDNCHGEGASGPLRDSFLILFLKPESDVSVRYKNFFLEANPYLEMTNVSDRNYMLNINKTANPFSFKSNQENYGKIKQRYQKALLPNGFVFEDIWDGEKGTQMPLYTINRHEKTVSVHEGAWGPQQRVSLLFDYVSFERLYYNCVALSTLYDKLVDKMGTVMYLRDVGREIENQMLSFVPEEYREQVLSEWIQGRGAKNRYNDSRFILPFNKELLKREAFTIDPSRPFLSMMDYMIVKSGRFTNQIIGPNHYPISTGSSEYLKLKALSNYMSQRADSAAIPSQAYYFPNVSYILVKAQNGTVRYYTMIANRFYDYVNYLPLESKPEDKLGRNPNRDWMTIYPDIQANYPGKIYRLNETEIDQFIIEMKNVSSRSAYVNFDKNYGLQKMSDQFWSVIDALQAYFIQSDNINNGAIELGEYGVHDLVGSP